MGTPLAAWLVDALIVAGLAMLLWLVVSFPLMWIKSALEAAGVLAFPGRVSAIAERLSPDGGAISRFFAHADASMTRNGDQASVRVVLDERHAELRDSLTRTEQSVRDVVSGVQGLAGHSATAFLHDISELRERTKLVDRIGVELSPDLEDEYARRSHAGGQLWVLLVLTALIALANGALLSVLFSEMTSMKVFGIPLAYLFGIVVVSLELGMGMALYAFRANPLMMTVLLVLIVVATLFEAAAMSIFSVEFATSMRDVDVSEARLQDYWMVLLAVVFTPMTSILGFMLDKTRAELSELKGKVTLGAELKACNQFVDELPTRWGQIEQKAHSAESAIERFQDALGGQGDRLSGFIDKLAVERKSISSAILAARVEDWSNLSPGAAADARTVAVQNIFHCLATLVVLGLYALGVTYLIVAASAGRWPIMVPIAAGCVAAFLFLVVGNLAFKRLRLVQGQDGRALPMSSQGYHKVVAGLLVAGCALGLIWVSVVALGAWGVIVGVFLTALGGVLSFLGYGVERAMRGFVLLSSLIIAFIVAISTTLLALARYVLLWFAAALAWLVGFVVRLLAMPAEAFLSAARRPRAQAGHPPAAALEVSQ